MPAAGKFLNNQQVASSDVVTTHCQVCERKAERLLRATQDVRDMRVGRALDIPPTESQLHAPYPLALIGLAWTPCGHFPRDPSA